MTEDVFQKDDPKILEWTGEELTPLTDDPKDENTQLQ